MGAVAAFIPTMAKVIGGLLVANEVDDLVGSPVKSAIGIKSPEEKAQEAVEEQKRNYDLEVRENQIKTEAKSRAQGLANYLATLESVAPGFVDRNRKQLTKSYDKAIDYKEQRLEQNEEDLGYLNNLGGKLGKSVVKTFEKLN